MTSIEKDLRELIAKWSEEIDLGDAYAKDLESLIPRIVGAVEQAREEAEGQGEETIWHQIEKYFSGILLPPNYDFKSSSIEKLEEDIRLYRLKLVEQAQADAIQSAAEEAYWECDLKTNTPQIHSVAARIGKRIEDLAPRRVQIEAELRKLTVEVVTTKLCGELWDQEKGTAIRELLVQLLAKKAILERELEAERKGVME